MSPQNSKNSDTKRSIWPKLITFTLILLVIVVAVSLLPRGFSQDTSIVGKGTRVVVLVNDNNVIQSGETMVAMNEVRDEYEGRVAFVVVDIMTPEGRAFADKYGLQPTALVFFAGNGERLQTLYTPQIGESLRENLNSIFRY
ncbi:MAG: hypothetical protein Q8K59_08640 [Nitrosomonas sp.]|nr:hypothetical protein [Nitrosomonas sp.]MDP1951142.1 hypothetical protein [Nitrosomonas sp.]